MPEKYTAFIRGLSKKGSKRTPAGGNEKKQIMDLGAQDGFRHTAIPQ
jgi:hypothetical protein